MLDKLVRATAAFGQGNNDFRGGGCGFEERKEFVSHVETDGGGFFGRQGLYDHPVKRRPQMTHMTSCDEDSEVDEYFETRTHHSSNNNYHHQPPPLSFMPPPSMAPLYHNGQHGGAYHGSHGMKEIGGHGMEHHSGHRLQQHGSHGMKHQGGYEMQHHDSHGMNHYSGHEMQHHGSHGMKHPGGYEMQHYGSHGMQHHGGHGMRHHNGHGMHHGSHGMQHHGGHMSPPGHARHMSPPGHGSGRTVVVKTTENWKVDNMGKAGWGSKGL